MTDAFWHLAVVALCAVGLVAPRLDTVPKRVLRIITLYYTLSYIGRGAYLLTYDPDPGRGTFVADALLLQPTYADSLARLAPLAACGLASVFVGYFAASSRSAQVRAPRSRVRGWRATAIGTAALVWPVRVVTALAGVTRPTGITGRLAVVPGIMLGILVICTDWRRNRVSRVAVVLLAAGEVYWSFHTDTKTPMLAAAAFFYIDPNRRRLTWQTAAGGAFAFILAFGVLQSGKTDLHPSDHADSAALAPAGRVLVRFDLLRALTVAEERGVDSYMPASEFVGRAADTWLPTSVGGGSDKSSGVLWGERINGSTSGTSLSDGPTAEGYVMAGVLGTIGWGVAVGALTAVVARAVARGRSYLLVLMAMSMIASNAVFERGLLGLNEAASNAFQIAIVAAIPYLIVRAALVTQSHRSVRAPGAAREGPDGTRVTKTSRPVEQKGRPSGSSTQSGKNTKLET